MKGNTIEEFLDDILTMGGPEKEFNYKGNPYMLETDRNWETDKIELIVFECFGDENIIYKAIGDNYKELLDQFVDAKIFDGRTILEAHEDIEITFG